MQHRNCTAFLAVLRNFTQIICTSIFARETDGIKTTKQHPQTPRQGFPCKVLRTGLAGLWSEPSSELPRGHHIGNVVHARKLPLSEESDLGQAEKQLA